MANEDEKDTQRDEGPTELDRLKDLTRKLLQVPKDEIKALREKRKTEEEGP